MFDEGDAETPEAPTHERVARRALVLSAVAMRSEIESEGASPENIEYQSKMLEWLAHVGADAECEPREWAMLRADIGEMTPEQTVNASWEAEGTAVLAWALNLLALAPFDQPCQPASVAEVLGFWQPIKATALAKGFLRHQEEVAVQADELFTLHWRLREYDLQREPVDLTEVASRTNFGLTPTGLPLINGDLAIDGRALVDVPEARWRECLSIASERHRAVNWLMGFEATYSEVTADT